MKTITSRTNPEISHLSSLQLKKYRIAHRQFIAEGMRTCQTLIKGGTIPLIALYVTEQHRAWAETLAHSAQVVLVSDSVMAKISTVTTPSGIVGLFALPPKPDPTTLTHGLVLAHIADPGNVGTLMRTATALNNRSIVLIEGADPWSPKVVQASAGTIGMLTIFQLGFKELLKHKGSLKLYALTVSGGKNPTHLKKQKALLVVGSEAHGIPAAWIADCDETITLPMPGGTESFNAAVAGSIALYLMEQSAI